MDKDSASFSFASMPRPSFAYTIPPWVIISLFIKLDEFTSLNVHLFLKLLIFVTFGSFLALLVFGVLNIFRDIIRSKGSEGADYHFPFKVVGVFMISIGLISLSLEKTQIEAVAFGEPVTYSLIALGFMYLRLKVD